MTIELLSNVTSIRWKLKSTELWGGILFQSIHLEDKELCTNIKIIIIEDLRVTEN